MAAKARLGCRVGQAQQRRTSGIMGPRELDLHITFLLSSRRTSRPPCATPLWVDERGVGQCGCTSVVGTCMVIWGNGMNRGDAVI